jgi:O-antigen ligase
MWILILMVLIMPFERNPYLYISSSVLGLFPDFTVIKLLGIVGVLWAALKLGTGTRDPGILRSSPARAFVVFVCIALAAGLLNGAVMRPLTRFLSIVLLLPFIVVAVADGRRLKLIVRVAAASLIIVFPYAMRQVSRYGGRLGVGLYEANYLAISMVLLAPLPFVFMRYEASVSKRLFWMVGGVVVPLAIVLTGSRGGFVGLLTVALFLVVKMARRRFRTAAGVVAGLAVLLFLVPNPLLERIRASGLHPGVRDAGVDYSDRARMDEIKGGLRMIRARPISGVGLGNYKEWMEGFSDLETVAIAHNTYLQIAAELGLPALLAFLVLIGCTYRSLSEAGRLAQRAGETELRDIASAVQVGLLGFLASAMFLSAEFEKFFWLIVFLSVPLERAARRQWRSVRSRMSSGSLENPASVEVGATD